MRVVSRAQGQPRVSVFRTTILSIPLYKHSLEVLSSPRRQDSLTIITIRIIIPCPSPCPISRLSPCPRFPTFLHTRSIL